MLNSTIIASLLCVYHPCHWYDVGWAGEKHVCLDLTGVSSLVGLRNGCFLARQTTLKKKYHAKWKNSENVNGISIYVYIIWV